jgi:hypothetical protein
MPKYRYVSGKKKSMNRSCDIDVRSPVHTFLCTYFHLIFFFLISFNFLSNSYCRRKSLNRLSFFVILILIEILFFYQFSSLILFLFVSASGQNSSLFNEFVCKLGFLGTRRPLKRSFHSRFKLAHSCQKSVCKLGQKRPMYTRTS